LVTLIYGWLGITIHPIDEETKKRLETAKEKEEAAAESA
jgi:hypothetical protein